MISGRVLTVQGLSLILCIRRMVTLNASREKLFGDISRNGIREILGRSNSIDGCHSIPRDDQEYAEELLVGLLESHLKTSLERLYSFFCSLIRSSTTSHCNQNIGRHSLCLVS
ncbi:hypothetical protein JHK87_050871 [Glycine soja]|nr:hypothetical protein JHK87_050871 [Glycine soja]